MTLGGKTPNETYFTRPSANEQPRFEPRERWRLRKKSNNIDLDTRFHESVRDLGELRHSHLECWDGWRTS